jgi:serine/threonine protein kinase
VATAFGPAGTTLVERLGVGSVFEVALVRDTHGRVLVAKRIAPAARSTEAELALARERDVLCAARGAPLPELFAAGTDEWGSFLLETRALGRTARSFIESGLLPDADRWLMLARGAARGLARLHAWEDAVGPLGITHGDISPDHLFFSEGGRLTLIDFSSTTWRTAPAPVFARDRGTLPYAAPELLREEASPDQAADVYALAATLLALAVGSITRTEGNAARLFEVATEGVRSERLLQRADLPARARDAVVAALRFDRSLRLGSAKELANELSFGGT